MNGKSFRITLDRLSSIAWVLFLISLPITSFPFLPPAIGGQALVRPLAIYPLILVVPLVTLPRLIKTPMPRTILPLFAFVCVVTATSSLALLGGMDELRRVSSSARLLRNLATLGLGGMVYLSVSLVPRSRKALNEALRWIYVGFSAALFWGSLQVVYVVKFSQTYFNWIQDAQRLISTRKLFPTRISGMTFEPNWFAEQICLLLLPWLLGSVLSGFSVFSWRYRKVTVEWLLLGWSIVILTFTFSRVGLFVLIVLLLASAAFLRPRRKPTTQQEDPFLHRVRRPVEIGLLAIVLAGIVLFAGTQNRYFSRLWRYWSDSSGELSYLEYLAVAPRFTYLQAAYNMYAANPVAGVGLGNFAFFLEEMLPERPLNAQPEVIRLITPDENNTRLVTSKNLYARLLAETGLLGTAVFATLVISLVGVVLSLVLSRDQEQIFWGKAGMLGMLALTILAFSFDSFALPNMWVVFGLITAAGNVYHQKDIGRATA